VAVSQSRAVPSALTVMKLCPIWANRHGGYAAPLMPKRFAIGLVPEELPIAEVALLSCGPVRMSLAV